MKKSKWKLHLKYLIYKVQNIKSDCVHIINFENDNVERVKEITTRPMSKRTSKGHRIPHLKAESIWPLFKMCETRSQYEPHKI